MIETKGKQPVRYCRDTRIKIEVLISMRDMYILPGAQFKVSNKILSVFLFINSILLASLLYMYHYQAVVCPPYQYQYSSYDLHL